MSSPLDLLFECEDRYGSVSQANAVHMALSQNDEVALRASLSQLEAYPALLTCPDSSGKTPLQYAKNPAMFKILLEFKVPVPGNYCGSYHDQNLWQEDPDITRSLVELKADPTRAWKEALTRYGHPPNMAAAQLLMELKASPSSEDLTNVLCRLVRAEDGQVEAVRHLIDAKADPNSVDFNAVDQLFGQCYGQGHEPVVQLLLDSKMDPNKLFYGKYAMLAIALDSLPLEHVCGVVELLRSYGSNPSAESVSSVLVTKVKNYCSRLNDAEFAYDQKVFFEVVNTLVELKADVNAVDGETQTSAMIEATKTADANALVQLLEGLNV